MGTLKIKILDVDYQLLNNHSNCIWSVGSHEDEWSFPACSSCYMIWDVSAGQHSNRSPRGHSQLFEVNCECKFKSMRWLLISEISLAISHNTSQLNILTSRIKTYTKGFWKLLKIHDAHFLVYYNVIKAMFIYTDISKFTKFTIFTNAPYSKSC